MSDNEPIKFRPPHRSILVNDRGKGRVSEPLVSFNRRELDLVLRLYGLQVGAGEWRDYAIDMGRERAVFSIYRRASEVPLYRIEKNPALARRQGAYSVIAATGLILKRGRELDKVLRVLEPKPKLAVR